MGGSFRLRWGLEGALKRTVGRNVPWIAVGNTIDREKKMNIGRTIASICMLTLAACAHTPEATEVKVDKFWFIFLETGKKTPDDKELVGKMQRGHIDNFKRLHGENKLFAAGPLQDPSTLKRGIVVAKAPSNEVLKTYFQPDEYVREGYMTLNAMPAVAHRALESQGIDPNGIEEVRIIQILRASPAAATGDAKANSAFLQALIDKGTVGAWYSVESGSLSEVLFSRTTDTKMLEDTFAQYPATKSGDATVAVWRQWLGKGVVK